MLVVMNQPSLEKFRDAVVPGGVVVADATMVPDASPAIEGVRVVALPATAMAEEHGLKGLANVILVGKLFAETGFCDRATLDAAIGKCVPARKAAMVEKNKQALQTRHRGVTAFCHPERSAAGAEPRREASPFRERVSGGGAFNEEGSRWLRNWPR